MKSLFSTEMLISTFILLSKDGVALLIQAYSPVSQFYTRLHKSNKYLKNTFVSCRY